MRSNTAKKREISNAKKVCQTPVRINSKGSDLGYENHNKSIIFAIQLHLIITQLQ